MDTLCDSGLFLLCLSRWIPPSVAVAKSPEHVESGCTYDAGRIRVLSVLVSFTIIYPVDQYLSCNCSHDGMVQTWLHTRGKKVVKLFPPIKQGEKNTDLSISYIVNVFVK